MFILRHLEGAHAEIGGDYSMGPRIIIDAAEIAPSRFEVAALRGGGDEIEIQTAGSEADARRIFFVMVQHYAEPLQRVFAGAGLKPSGKYTIFHLGEFGFPIAQKITFHKMEFATYAQYRDAVKLTFTPYRKRTRHCQYFYDMSLIICDGWQDINEMDIKDILNDTPQVRLTKSKYPCFDYRYIEDAERYLKNIIAVHKDYKTGVNGRQYA